jgi:hypothetical protein
MQPRSSCFYLNALFFRRGDIYGREAETLVELLDREFEHLAARTPPKSKTPPPKSKTPPPKPKTPPPRTPSPSRQMINGGSNGGSNAAAFNAMLNQYNQLQQQTMLENMEMQKAQAFWNPLESISKKDATS